MYFLKKGGEKASEKAQQLRAVAAILEDSVSFPSVYLAAHSCV